MSKYNPECCGCGTYIKYAENIVEGVITLVPYCPTLFVCPSKDKKACETKPVHNWEQLGCGCVTCRDCPITEDDNCPIHKRCRGNFHMPDIRKQYTKVETCDECGKN